VKNKSLVGIALVFVLPVVIVSLPGIPVWLSRSIAVSTFIFFTTVGIFWFGLSPKSKMIMGGSLAESRYDRVRPKIDLGIRGVVVAFGVLFFVYKTLPLGKDIFHLATGEKPTKLTATVAYRTSSMGAVLLGERSVRFARDTTSYYLFYSWTSPLYIGESYEFLVLPRSRMILDFRRQNEIRLP
jgi:hypothetical protein